MKKVKLMQYGTKVTVGTVHYSRGAVLAGSGGTQRSVSETYWGLGHAKRAEDFLANVTAEAVKNGEQVVMHVFEPVQSEMV